MTETLEQITERATREAEAKYADPPIENEQDHWYELVMEERAMYRKVHVEAVIAEATRDRWIKVENGLFLAPYGTTETVLTYCKREGIKQRVAYVGQWPSDVTHYQPLPTSPTP